MSVWKSDETLLSICILNFSFKNDFVWEEISNIRHSVSSPYETPRSSSKILRCASYFQFSSRCFIWWWNTASHVWYITWILGKVLEKSLNFRGSPWKVLEFHFSLDFCASPWKVLEFSSTLNVVAWKVFLMLFGCLRQNINHSSENLKVFYIKWPLFYSIINYQSKTSELKKVEKLVTPQFKP